MLASRLHVIPWTFSRPAFLRHGHDLDCAEIEFHSFWVQQRKTTLRLLLPTMAGMTFRMNPSRIGLVVAFLLAVVSATPALAQNPMYCQEIGFAGGGKIQVNGFSIEAESIPDPNVPGYTMCHASVTSPQGKTVYEQNDWAFEIDPVTGKDVNGDGQPDAVLIGLTGGAHCCWDYEIISLGKQPGLIGEFENRDTASFSDLRGDDQIEIVIRDGSFDFGFGLDHAFSVFPTLIVQLKGRRFEDVGREFWPIFQKEIGQERSKLKAQSLQTFLDSNPYEAHDSLDYQATQSGILFIALDYLYAGKPEEAKATLSTLWPAASRARTWKEMLDGYCSGLRADLGVQSLPPCKGARANTSSAF